MSTSNPVRAVRPSAVYLEQHSDRNRTRSEDEPASGMDLPRLDHNPTSRDTARACVYDTYGPPDVQLRDVVSARPPGRPMKKSEWFWDWRARKYDEQAQEDEAHTRAVERFSKYLKADDTVLDYACGTGVVTFKIAADVKEVHAIDISAGMIDLAKERASESQVTNVHFARKTIFDEGLGSGSYDVILAFNILHLLEDARQAVKRISELLKPGGLMVSVTPCLGEAGVVLRTLLPLTSKVGILSYLRTFRIADVNDLMHDGGFEILESEVLECTIPSSSVVARKRFA